MTNFEKIEAAGIEVVRCKNCIYGEKDLDDEIHSFNYLCRYDGDSWNNGDHFCAYGEEKTDDEL